MISPSRSTKGQFTYTQDNAKDSYDSAGTFTVDGDTVDLYLDNTEHFVMRWNVEDDTLTFERDDALGIAPTPLILNPWRRSG